MCEQSLEFCLAICWWFFFHKKNLSSEVKYFSIVTPSFSFLWLVKFLVKVNCHTLPGTFFLVSGLELTHPRKSRSSCSIISSVRPITLPSSARWDILRYHRQLCARRKTPNYSCIFFRDFIYFFIFKYFHSFCLRSEIGTWYYFFHMPSYPS